MVAETKRQKVAAKAEQVPVVKTNGRATSAPPPPPTDMTVQDDGSKVVAAASGGNPVLGKLDEIIKMQAKLQRAQAKTQKQVALILTMLDAEDVDNVDADEEEPTVGKKRSRAAVARAKRAPSGFDKPSYLSPELCEFLELPLDSQLPRTDVTKRPVAYVKAHNLQKESNKRVILPCDKLQTLLQPPKVMVITFFTVQKLLPRLYSNTPFSEHEE
jgi:chromatin remodeling complex protein RSC6